MVRPDDKDDKKGLDEAKKELSEMRGRPFDVDKILAAERARKEREGKAAAAIHEKLEKEHALARERRHELRGKEVEREREALEEKQLHLEHEKRHFHTEEAKKRSTVQPKREKEDIRREEKGRGDSIAGGKRL